MQRATILRSNLAGTVARMPASIVQNCRNRNVVVRARVETLFLEEGFVAPEFSLPWPEKGFEPTSLMKDVVKVRLGFRSHLLLCPSFLTGQSMLGVGSHRLTRRRSSS